MKLLIRLRYNGANYSGYQAQDDERAPKPSIQRTLTRAFSDCLGFDCMVTGCSRTDAGVHALGFCATVEPKGSHADDWLKIPVGRVHRAMNRYLPGDIAISGEALVPDGFHPRYSVVSKEYRYKMTDTVWNDPFSAGFAWHLPRPLPPDGIERMQKAAAHLVGRRDYTSFMAAGSKIADAHRTIGSLSIAQTENDITLAVSADGFLYHMVRIIAGTLIDCAYGTIEPEEIPKILEAKDRAKAGRTAPAHGLYLAKVEYGFPIAWKCE